MKIGYFTFTMFLCSLFLHVSGFAAPPPSYCLPNSVNGNQINPNKIWAIHNLKLARLSLPYWGSQGYSFLDLQSDYELFQGRSYRLNVSADISPLDPNTQLGFYKVWIDFNGDGSFDNSEAILSQSAISLGYKFSPTFSVPANAYISGAVRMRIAVSESDILSPCDDIQSGIMVDISVKIHPASEGLSGDGYCLPVENYSSQQINTVYLDQAKLLNGSTNVSYKEVDYNLTNFQAGMMHTINLIPEPSNETKEFIWNVWLDVNGNKQFEFNELVYNGVSDENGNQAMFSIPLNAVSGKTRMRVSMGDPVGEAGCSYVEYGQVIDFTIILYHLYCTDFKALDGSDHYIKEFSTPKLSNPSGPGPYNDYTNISPFIDMFCVSAWTYDLSVNVKSSQGASYVIAAIDFNQDQFFSKDEIVVPSTIIISNQLVSLPAFKACNPNMIAGKTRFRIASGNKPFPADFDFCTLDPEMKGEIEDYTVNLGYIKDSPPLNEKSGTKELGEVILYPNPAKESVQWTAPIADRSNYQLSVTDFMGTPVLRGTGVGSGGTIDVSGFVNGIYLIVIKSEDETSYRGRISVSK